MASHVRAHRRRVLIVNCFFDDTRQTVRQTHKVPQALAPVFLAGAFAPEHCEVRIVSELVSGPLEDGALIAWADLLVLTGLTNALDRMRQLTAYARTLNPSVIVVAGGHAVRSFPNYCRRVFDYACLGDADDLRLSLPQLSIAAMHGALLALPHRASAPGGSQRGEGKRTHISTTDILDPAYRPALPVAAEQRHLFEPLMLTNANGAIAQEVADDLLRAAVPAVRVIPTTLPLVAPRDGSVDLAFETRPDLTPRRPF